MLLPRTLGLATFQLLASRVARRWCGVSPHQPRWALPRCRLTGSCAQVRMSHDNREAYIRWTLVKGMHNAQRVDTELDKTVRHKP